MKELSDFGLTKETMYDPDVAMPYWQAYSNSKANVMKALIHDAREELSRMSIAFGIVHDRLEVAATPSVSDALISKSFALIDQHQKRMEDVLTFMWVYIESLEAGESYPKE